MSCKKMILAGLVLSASLVLGCAGKTVDPVSTEAKGENQPQINTESQVSTEPQPGSESTGSDVNPEKIEKIAEKANTFYLWYNFMDAIVMDSLGEVKKASDINYSIINDCITGETVYYVASYKYVEKDENGESTYKQKSRLYNLEGEPINDWSDDAYGEAIGDSLLVHDYYNFMWSYDENMKRSLVNLKDNTVIDGVQRLSKLGKSHVAVYGHNDVFLGIVDQNGHKTAGFPFEYNEKEGGYVEVAGNYLVSIQEERNAFSENMNIVYTVYDETGTFVGTITHNSNDGFLKNFDCPYNLILIGGTLYDPSKVTDGVIEPIFTSLYIEYCDEEIAIADNGEGGYSLCNYRENKLLAEGFSTICNADNYDTYYLDRKTPEYFLGAKNGKIYKIGRDGTILKEADGDGYIASYESGVFVTDYENYLLFDTDLNPIALDKKYNNVHQIYSDKEDPKRSIWSSNYQIYNGNERTDIYRLDGTKILEGASSVTQVQDGKMAVIYGRYMGLMDTEGNWIYRIRRSDVESMD